jgi:hypothetical protein
MYSIPKDVDIKKLESATLIQICYSANTISLYFEEIGYVTTSGRFVITHNGIATYHEISSIPITEDFGILKLMGKKVFHVFADEKSKNLNIQFEDNFVLELINDACYESFIISIEGKVAII